MPVITVLRRCTQQGSEGQGYPWLRSKTEAILGYIKPISKMKTEQRPAALLVVASVTWILTGTFYRLMDLCGRRETLTQSWDWGHPPPPPLDFPGDTAPNSQSVVWSTGYPSYMGLMFVGNGYSEGSSNLLIAYQMLCVLCRQTSMSTSTAHGTRELMFIWVSALRHDFVLVYFILLSREDCREFPHLSLSAVFRRLHLWLNRGAVDWWIKHLHLTLELNSIDADGFLWEPEQII